MPCGSFFVGKLLAREPSVSLCLCDESVAVPVGFVKPAPLACDVLRVMCRLCLRLCVDGVCVRFGKLKLVVDLLY